MDDPVALVQMPAQLHFAARIGRGDHGCAGSDNLVDLLPSEGIGFSRIE